MTSGRRSPHSWNQLTLFEPDRAVVTALRCPACSLLVRGSTLEESIELQRRHCEQPRT